LYGDILLNTPFRVLSLILIAVGIFFRFYGLDHLPGINGDEAWYGVKAVQWVHFNLPTLYSGSGILLNPFYFLPLSLLHVFFEPSFFLLRSVALFSGISALFFAFFLFKKIWGTEKAFLLTLLFSSGPIPILYSKIGWDTSQTFLISIISFYFAEKRQTLFLVLCLVVAILIHPTNLFLSFYLLAPFLNQAILHGKLTGPIKNFIPYLNFIGQGLILFSVAGLTFFLLRHSSIFINEHTPDLLINLSAFSKVNVLKYSSETLVRFLAGITAYDYLFTKPLAFVVYIHLFMLSIFGGLLIYATIKSPKEMISRASLFSLSIVVFFILGGPLKLAPGWERYGLWLLATFYFLLITINDNPKLRMIFRSIVIGYSCIALMLFYHQFYSQSSISNFDKKPTFWTGKSSIKKEAAIQIKNYSRSSKLIYTPDWWTYWPIKYLFAKSDNVAVTILNQPWDLRFGADFNVNREEAYSAIFYLTYEGSLLADRIVELKLMDSVVPIFGYGTNQPLYLIFVRNQSQGLK
jgi:hypothetical protein